MGDMGEYLSKMNEIECLEKKNRELKYINRKKFNNNEY